jgi:hypothetical protein
MRAIKYSEFKALKQELDNILETMNVPGKRKDDLRWLRRNLRFYNSFHHKINRAYVILNILIANEEV